MDVQTAAVTEEVITEEVVKIEEAVVQEKPAVEKVPPRLEEFPKPQALREGETLVLSCKVSGQFKTCCTYVALVVRRAGTKHKLQGHTMRGPDRESSEGVEERGMGRGIIYRVLCSCTQKIT